jgi:hypothetical protein
MNDWVGGFAAMAWCFGVLVFWFFGFPEHGTRNTEPKNVEVGVLADRRQQV